MKNSLGVRWKLSCSLAAVTFVSLLVHFDGAAFAQNTATEALQSRQTLYAEAAENANRQAKEWVGRGIPGLAIAVAVDGRIVFSEGFG